MTATPRYTMRLVVPLLLFVCGILAGTVAAQSRAARAERGAEALAAQRGAYLAEFLAAEAQSHARTHRPERIQQLLNRAADRDVDWAGIVGADHQVLYSTAMRENGTRLDLSRFPGLGPHLDEALASTRTVFSPDGNRVYTLQPISIEGGPTEVPLAEESANLVLVHDVSTLRHQARRGSLGEVFEQVLPLGVLCLALAGLFHVTYTRRMHRLVEHTTRVAEGNFAAAPVSRYDDEITSLSHAFNEMVARLREQQETLAEGEERFREMTENSHQLFWLIEPGLERALYVSPAVRGMFGVEPEEAIQDPWAVVGQMSPEAKEAIVGLFDLDALPGEATYRVRPAPGQRERVLHTRAYPVRNADGELYRISGITEDITERAEAAERRRLLVAELDHRVKNTLAVVTSLAEETLTTHDDAVKGFFGRLHSMARTHELLAASRWDGVDLEQLLLDAVAFARAHFDADGPPVRLSAQSATPVGLCLHELATNATKYGALSEPGGRVGVTWTVQGSGVTLEWAESGGPPVDGPGTPGVGTELITGMIEYQLSGSVTFRWEREGLNCTLWLPRSEVIG